MSATYQSIQTTAYQTTGTLTITKPVSLAVGDLMVGFVHNETNATFSSPSGWTDIKDLIATSGSSRIRVSYKIADSSDVAATNFSWTGGGAGNRFGGSILRITDFNSATPASVFGFNEQTSTASPTFNSTVTPTTANSLILFCLGTFQNTSVTRTASGYAVATSNPSWTEQLDQTNNNGTCMQMSLATAVRPQTTATGNATVTMSGSCVDLENIMVVIRPNFSSTNSETISLVETVNKTVGKFKVETISLVDTSISLKGRIWRTISKPVTTWINRIK